MICVPKAKPNPEDSLSACHFQGGPVVIRLGGGQGYLNIADEWHGKPVSCNSLKHPFQVPSSTTGWWFGTFFIFPLILGF